MTIETLSERRQVIVYREIQSVNLDVNRGAALRMLESIDWRTSDERAPVCEETRGFVLTRFEKQAAIGRELGLYAPGEVRQFQQGVCRG